MEDERLRVGVIGLGLIAQAVHLPNLALLRDRFVVSHVCDLSQALADSVGRQLPQPIAATTDWREVIRDPRIDAVLVLTPGTHADLTAAALAAGKHVFAEKPLGSSQAEIEDLIRRTEVARRVLQVGYMKMHDPAIAPARAALEQAGEVRLVRITVRHPSEQRQTEGLVIERARGVDPARLAEAMRGQDAGLTAAVGSTAPAVRALYRDVMLGSVVHELSLLRALGMGLPLDFDHVRIWPSSAARTDGEPPSVLAHAQLEDGSAFELAWLWLPDYPAYEERLTVIGAHGAVSLSMPPPYGEPVGSELVVRLTGEAETIERDAAPGGSSFRRELEAFHASVTRGARVTADARGALADTACLQAIVRRFAADRGLALGGEAAEPRTDSALE